MKARFKFVPIFIALGFAASAGAAEYGTVVSSTPIVRAVPVAQRECVDQPVVYQAPTSGVGALIGALTGAAIGNSVGGGGGRAAATGIGLIAGSVIGDRVEGNAIPPVDSTVRQCRTVTRYENRTVGYDVVYDYQGVRRYARMATDPGERIALNVSVAPSDGTTPPLVYSAAPPRVEVDPAPPIVYVAPAYSPPVYVNSWPVVGVGYGWHGRRHREDDDD